ncbi:MULTISPECIES: Fe-S cluster assembly sulfur transfer protein SufU [Breznakia]|uniref:Nitrogen fixation NifU-like protein n=1 Tax=Breznakia blatticola TaxID=1754012 RepID=A0A4R7Z8U1_9FIRM|nr:MULTISPECIES: SUF system NifU family Fe-S cluster assembly protein [Breznakia]MDH6367781.1 nitrogen fixation NifU-like protein [Breznakia sp. PH1-1]MDH6404865.1 nitrogen fixation NifU-like protein [Breznakia sp. PF1-11]MDH6412580.1 nitrogen fixation NifU-like protein [Breznakia sp. PFB1-11]MDH6414944.1 nitrogen fixation NifU-like protein [Breznakia sp. PFB1-14]MDH6417255.1 nitrogen fixation NifU-like protein [Breznakia sp. PFB1-4]
MSSMMNDPMILRQIIMDHGQNPRNHELSKDPEYKEKHMASDSCIDDIHVQAKIKDGKIDDVRFDGVACTISTSSTSIMSELLIGKTIEEAREIIKNYRAMIDEKPYDEDLLEEAIAFQNVGKQANRIHCATIGWDGMEALIDESEENHD